MQQNNYMKLCKACVYYAFYNLFTVNWNKHANHKVEFQASNE